MKQLLFILLFPSVGYAQNVNVDTLSFIYSGVEQVDGVPARVLQSRARIYLAMDPSAVKEITKVDDVDGSVLIIDDYEAFVIKESPGMKDSSSYGHLNFLIKIVCKDGKYKYTCYNCNHTAGDGASFSGGFFTNSKPACGTFGMSMTRWRVVKVTANNNISHFVEGLKAAMKSDEIDPAKPDF